MHSTHKLVQVCKGLVIPTGRVTFSSMQDAAVVVGRKVVSSCRMGLLEASVGLFQVVGAAPHNNVGCISRKATAGQSTNIILQYLAS
jgi:hypothetical protein